MRNLMAMTLADGVFGGLSVVLLAAAVLVVTTRNIIHAALWLVVCLGALAGCYLVLTAEFLAWVQVLIYVGAVVVLMLFGAMLTRAPIGSAQDLDSRNRPLAALAGLATGGVLVALTINAFRSAYIDIQDLPIGNGKAIGTALFRFYVLPFEVASVLLLAALVGAIVLTGRSPAITGEPEERG
jgi:NADH-quinone oxidoreductase subunit J